MTSNGKKKEIGFTLIEMMVVVSIMVVVVAMSINSYAVASKKNRDNRRLADLERIRIALETFRQNDVGGSYPVDAQTALVSGGYLGEWPIGPGGKDDVYVYNRTDPYRYTIFSTLEMTGERCWDAVGECNEMVLSCSMPHTHEAGSGCECDVGWLSCCDNLYFSGCVHTSCGMCSSSSCETSYGECMPQSVCSSLGRTVSGYDCESEAWQVCCLY